MHTFKIILINEMYIIHESNSISFADIRTYSGPKEKIDRKFVHGELFDKDGNGPLNDGYIDLYDHSILVIYKVK